MSDTHPKFAVLAAARLIDGNGGAVAEQAAILLRDDVIVQVGTREAVHAPEGAPATEIDYGDATILPGLVDCHVHVNGIGDGRAGDDLAKLPDEVLTVQSAQNVRKHLFSGVTTLRDCGAKNRTTFHLRDAVEMGILPSPRLILAGRPIAIIGGHLSYFGVQATGTNECRVAVRQLIKEGADFIKVTATGGSTRTSFPNRPSFNLEEFTAITDEAHRFGKHVAAHCVGSLGMENAIAAGVDTIIHGVHKDLDGSDNYRADISDAIAERGIFVNPTLGQSVARIRMLEDNPDLATGADEIDNLRRGAEVRMDHVARMRDAGVMMVAGSDSAWSHYPMGDFQTEIEAHAMSGTSYMEAIVSATRDSAASCQVHEIVGTIEVGKTADILIVDGDPTQDLNSLRKIKAIYQDGIEVDRANLV